MADSYASDHVDMNTAAIVEEGDDVVAKEDEEEDEEDVEEESGREKAVAGENSNGLHPSVKEEERRPSWEPYVFSRQAREKFHFVGRDITIYESTDDLYGNVLWPAALALCKYLETNREQIDLLDKYVLELGAGTGLVSIVAALLGAWVTATDLPEILNNLRFNLLSNTRGRCKYLPQVAQLSWSDDLDRTYPKSVYRYDYIMATDVVYGHAFLDDLLVTMKHFCQPGTKLIWANNMRIKSDLSFTEKFKKTFDITFLAEVGEAKIFMATRRDEGGEPRRLGGTRKTAGEMTEDGKYVSEDEEVVEEERKDREVERKCEEERPPGTVEDEGYEDDEENPSSRCSTVATDDDLIEETPVDTKETSVQPEQRPSWAQSPGTRYGRDIYFYAGQEISISEALDTYGAVMWPAALALCHFLETNPLDFNLKDKAVLELGAGTGIVSIVASLLGASVTATDLTDVMVNLRSNLSRNTSGRTRHTPQVAELSWGHDLDALFPASARRYDYVLAADVVYHHGYLKELLATMRHFCRPGTRLLWANKVRFNTDLDFTEDFKSAFHATLLAELGVVKIFMATSRG